MCRFAGTRGCGSPLGGARSAGRDFSFEELTADPSTFPSGGESRGADGFVAGNVMGGLWLGWLRVGAHANVRTKAMPAGAYDTRVGDGRTQNTDRRGFVEIAIQPPLKGPISLQTRLVGNYFGFTGTYALRLPQEPLGQSSVKEEFRGLWATVEQRLVWTPSPAFKLSLGGEFQAHATRQQGIATDCDAWGECASAVYLPPTETFDEAAFDAHSLVLGAGYGVVDLVPTDTVRISAGARIDYYSTFGSSGPSPRAALILHPAEPTVVKLMGGRAFRAPSIFELFYSIEGVQAGNPDLEPETVWSGELEMQQRFSRTVSGTLAGYANYLDAVVVDRTPSESSVLTYENSDAPVLTLGGEADIRRDWRGGGMFAASYSLQRTRSEQDAPGRRVANSPTHIASARGALPLHGRAAVLGARVTVESGRYDRYQDAADSQPQGETSSSTVLDLVLSGDAGGTTLHYNVGFYNVGDARYEHPVSSAFPALLRTIPQRGRTLLVGLEWIP